MQNKAHFSLSLIKNKFTKSSYSISDLYSHNNFTIKLFYSFTAICNSVFPDEFESYTNYVFYFKLSNIMWILFYFICLITKRIYDLSFFITVSNILIDFNYLVFRIFLV